MKRSRRTGAALLVVLAVGVVALVVIAAGCGSSSTATTSPTPTAASSAPGALQQAAAFKAYVDQIKPIYNQIAATLGSLKGVGKGLGKTPNAKWKTTAATLTTASQQLNAEATSIQGITPPSALAGLQGSIVTGLQDAAKVLDTSANYLNKRVYDPSYPSIQTQIKQQVTDKLGAALQAAVTQVLSLLGPSASPTP